MPEKMTHFLNQFDYASLLQNAIRVAIIILFALIIWFIIRLVISRVSARMVKRYEQKGENSFDASQRAETLSRMIRRLVAALYWIAVVLTLLSQIGIDIGALVAGAGILGLALAFGAQGLVKDYISGFFIILENQLRIGDIAILNGTWGTVETINFRTTILRSIDGVVHVYRNGDITSLSNATKGWGGYVFKLHVGYQENTDRVIEIVKRVGEGMKNDENFGAEMISDMELHGVNSLTDSGVEIRGRFNTTPMNQWATGREFLARVKRAFDEEGINIAFPHQTLFFDEARTAPEFVRQSGSKSASDD